jgi:dihydrofolate reductase
MNAHSPRTIVWMQVSLDGFTQGPNGEFDWPQVQGEVHQYFVDTLRDAGTFVYGRNVFEMMASYWPTADVDPHSTQAQIDYSTIWKPMPKLVVSRTLRDAGWNATVTDHVDAEVVAEVKARSEGDVYLFGGAETVAEFARLDLIDEYQLFVHPILLGGGVPLFPALEQRQSMSVVEARVFDGAVAGLRYRRER